MAGREELTVREERDASIVERMLRFAVFVPFVAGVATGLIVQSWGAGILAFLLGGFIISLLAPGAKRRNPWSGIGYESKLKGKGLADSLVRPPDRDEH